MRVEQARRGVLFPGRFGLAALLVVAGGGEVAPRELRLADGRAAVAAGIVVLELPAQVLDASLADPQAAVVDRHGRLRGQLRGPDGAWLQAALVERGLALVAPAVDVAPGTLADLLRLERAARTARRGRWAGGSLGPFPAQRVAAAPGTFVLVRGTVRSVSRRYDLTYLDFGDDWRRDFTVRAETRSLAGFAREGLDLAALAGRRILVRGWLFHHAGPMVELMHPMQIEVEQ